MIDFLETIGAWIILFLMVTWEIWVIALVFLVSWLMTK